MSKEIELLLACGYGAQELRKMSRFDLYLLEGKVINDSILSKAAHTGNPLNPLPGRLAVLAQWTTGERAALRQRCAA